MYGLHWVSKVKTCSAVILLCNTLLVYAASKLMHDCSKSSNQHHTVIKLLTKIHLAGVSLKCCLAITCTNQHFNWLLYGKFLIW